MVARTLALIVSLFLAVAAAQQPPPLSEYQGRRLKLAQQIKGNVLLLQAAPDLELVEYQQEKNFYYLTGFNEPNATMLLNATVEPVQEFLFLPPRDADQERWTGPKLGPGSEAAQATGFAAVLSSSDLDATLRRLTDNGRTLLRLKDVQERIGAMRQVKSAAELGLLEKAVEITLKGEEAAAHTIGPGVKEYEVEAALEYQFRKNGAERPSFPSIVGSGPYSTILHYDKNDREMRAGETVVVDIGAEYRGYAGDVTRTFPVSGKFTPRQREIYQIVLDAQKAAIARLRPGVKLREVHQAAYDYIKSKGYEKYFIHGTSHHVGLDVHDVGDPNRTLEVNMVVTVEPGIYLVDEQLGVRIEDDFVVTTNGARMLSEFPKEIAAIEALMTQPSTQPAVSNQK